MCEYYLGDTETAVADLEALTTDDPEYATGWYDLGLLYEAQGLTDESSGDGASAGTEADGAATDGESDETSGTGE